MMVQKKSLEQLKDEANKARKRALASRDKKIVQKLMKLDLEYEKQHDKLATEAVKSMDSKLRSDWKKISKEYSNALEKIVLNLDRQVLS